MDNESNEAKRRALEKLLKLAETQGYITVDDIKQHCSDPRKSELVLAEYMLIFRAMNIKIR